MLIELYSIRSSAYGKDISYLFEIHVLVISTRKVQEERLKIVFTQKKCIRNLLSPP